MGLPSFYRWLVKKYPKIVSDANDSPNGGVMEFDNFYVDMNGIIHACFHPEDDLFPPTSFDEVFSRMYEFIDDLFNIVKPRKLLFLAIDGVAPRAKMNQQRARRFRASKDIQMAEQMEEKLRQQFEKLGKSLLPKTESQVSDSNVITPGTEFMHMLSKKLQGYIKLRMGTDQAWENIKVILSDDKVPGQGEHKIMSFIRSQRSLPGYDPNTNHCLYGLDADLIMLALATHEVHFSILREEVLSPINHHNNCPDLGHSLQNLGLEKLVSGKAGNVNKKQCYQFLNVWVLREYLGLEFDGACPDKDFDLERIIDDFIFICLFAGNDFLPHISCLGIHEACIDLLIHVYKEEFGNLGGYIVDMQRVDDKKGGFIKLKRVERFILLVGAYEEKIFDKRLELKDRLLRRIIAEYDHDKEVERIALDEGRISDVVCTSVGGIQEEMFARKASVVPDVNLYRNTTELKLELKDMLRKQSDLFKAGGIATDKVKFGKQGWRERYYQVKFNAQSRDETEAIRKSVVAKYGEGLCWTLLYYYSGVPSWTWFYPYHYGPLASDCKGLSQAKAKFEKGLPFKPFDQLMGVLPPSSAHALPAAYKRLMTDQNSSIIDLYPTDFEIDMDGKRYTWQGLCKLPFIEEARLLAETSKLEIELKDHEKVRNSETINQLFLHNSAKFSLGSSGARQKPSEKIKDAIQIESTIVGIKGVMHLMLDSLVEAYDGSEDVICLLYETREEARHIPRLPEGVKIPDKVVDAADIQETTLWHENRGRNSSFINRRAHPTMTDSFGEGAGRGFSLGRGKPHVSEYKHDFRPKYFQQNPPMSTSSSGKFTGRGRSGTNEYKHEFGYQKSAPQSSQNVGRFQMSKGNWQKVPNSKPNSFWPSRGNQSYESQRDSKEDWRTGKASVRREELVGQGKGFVELCSEGESSEDKRERGWYGRVKL